MDSKAHIRVFPHSRDEFPTVHSLQTWLMNSLKASGGNYYLRSPTAVKDLDRGSIMLFRYGDEIVGEAVVHVHELGRFDRSTPSGELVTYQSRIEIETSSIRLYAPPIPVEDLQKMNHDRTNMITSAQPYYRIDNWEVYPKLIASVIEKGRFIV